MADTATNVAYKAIRNRLGTGLEMWTLRVYPDLAPPKTPYPYVIMWWMGGGEANRMRKQDAEIVMGVKAVSDNMNEAMNGAARISALLNDKGLHDSLADYLFGSADWVITTVTQEGIIHLTENFAGVTSIYHEGARFRLIMERSS